MTTMKHLAVLLLLLTFISCEDVVPETRAKFKVTISNISSGDESSTFGGGVYLLRKEGFPLFVRGEKDFGNGLAELAEDGNNTLLASYLSTETSVLESGTFSSILAGQSKIIEFEADYGTFFNFATMFVESNDLFFSFDEDGILLFNANGEPITGDFTRLVWYWDAGTEENQAPYTGSFQPPRQTSSGQGTAESKPIELTDDGFSYPRKFNIIKVTVESTKL